jgi:hypothetical protein
LCVFLCRCVARVCNKPVPHGAIAMGTEVERSMNVTFNLCVFVRPAENERRFL